MSERCGCWVQAGDYETVCMLPEDHAGECLPNRSELTNEIEQLDQSIDAISDYITERDAQHPRPWPYEGPTSSEG